MPTVAIPTIIITTTYSVPENVTDHAQFARDAQDYLLHLLTVHGITHTHRVRGKLEVDAEMKMPEVRWRLTVGPENRRHSHNLFSYSVTHAEIAKLAGLKESNPIPYRIEHGNMVSEVFFLNPREVLYPTPDDTISVIHLE